MNCRYCSRPLTHTFLDLGFAPPSNAYLTYFELSCPEKYYPLKVMICDRCWLVQTEDYAQADELFDSKYAYFSSTSTGWLDHAERYSRKISKLLNLNKGSLVIEIASNDGYLLKNFVTSQIPCLGIEPTASTAAVAEASGIPVLREFFSESLGFKLASQKKCADLIIGNNVYAHVPNINDFTRGLKAALKPGGTITLEFPHLLRLIQDTQFDTIYHEHFSYLSLYTVENIFNSAGLRVFDAEELPTHGGSLRIFGCHSTDSRGATDAIERILKKEELAGLQTLSTYHAFQEGANRVKDAFLSFLIEQKKNGKVVAAYGAAAKGNTLLNYAGIKKDLLQVVCDLAISKQGKFLPGSHIPIVDKEILYELKPDIVIILPWNLASEIVTSLRDLSRVGTKFFVTSPTLTQID